MEIIIDNLINNDEKNGKSFIGMKKKENSYEVVGPYGLNFKTDKINLKNKKELYKIRILLKAIVKALKSSNVKMKMKESNIDGINVKSGIEIVIDYLENGIYREYEKHWKRSKTGKIDFKKTLNRVKPTVYKNNIIYLDYIVSSKRIKDEELVRQAQISIINDFMMRGGNIFFGFNLNIKGKLLKIDRILKNKLLRIKRESFNSRKIRLINLIIDYIDATTINKRDEDLDDNWSFMIIGSTFWEEIINACYGNQLNQSKTQYGNYYIRHHFFNNYDKEGRKTEHDSIYENDELILILDAKHYCKENNLLSASVLDKQFGYYYSAIRQKPNKDIYNLFIIPNLDGAKSSFKNYVLHRPEKPKAPNEFVFVYSANVDELIQCYLNGKNISRKLLSDLKDLLENQQIRSYLSDFNQKNNYYSNNSYFDI